MTNPLLDSWDAPFGLPPFAEITDGDFGPAFDAGLAEARYRSTPSGTVSQPCNGPGWAVTAAATSPRRSQS